MTRRKEAIIIGFLNTIHSLCSNTTCADCPIHEPNNADRLCIFDTEPYNWEIDDMERVIDKLNRWEMRNND